MRLFVDNLTNVDFSFLDSEKGLIGETWLASIEIQGTLDDQGMVCDFGIVKRTIRNWLESEIDHKLLVPAESDCVKLLKKDSDYCVEWTFGSNYLTTSSPIDAITVLPISAISASAIAAYCNSRLRALLPVTVTAINLTLRPETIEGPFYHYSHGLKKHDGHCQRIAHGHRSKIEIWQDDSLATELMSEWANKLSNIYIGSNEDLIYRGNKSENHLFRYQALHGNFSLSIPAQCVYLIDSDTTVEYIAQHIALSLKKEFPESSFKVKAYEGCFKGAIAIA